LSYNEGIWSGWYTVAEPLNKVTAVLTWILTLLCWFLFPLKPSGYNAYLLAAHAWRYICVLLAGTFYFMVLKKKIEIRDLTLGTHVWLWICFVLSWFSIAGVCIWVQFVMVGILSDQPFWKVFFEKYHFS
jgi:hypothetical protein